jgi:hypothetical protein
MVKGAAGQLPVTFRGLSLRWIDDDGASIDEAWCRRDDEIFNAGAALMSRRWQASLR